MKFFKLIIFIFLCHCISAVYGQESVMKVDGQNPLAIYKNFFHLKDSTDNIDIIKAIKYQKQGKFIQLRSNTNRQEFGYNTYPYWFNFKLDASEKTELILELEYNNMDHLELYELKNGKLRFIGKTGDIYPFRQRPYPNNNYVFPIHLEKGESASYFLYIKSIYSILSFTIELLTKAQFMNNDRKEYITWGIFIGIICLVMVVNLVMWLATNDKIYIWYTLYIHFMTMHVFSDAGLAFQYLWGDFPVINSYHPVYLYIWLGLIVQVVFMRKFIHQTSQNSKVYRWLNGLRNFVLCCFLAVILIRLTNWELANQFLFRSIATLSTFFVPIVFVLTIMSLYERRLERELLVKYYGWAVMIQFAGFLFVAFVTYLQATNLKISMPFDVLSYVIIGSILLFDILFFSFGLAYRYKNALNSNQILGLEISHTNHIAQQKIISALDYERRRLSQDLHDDLGATISTAKGYLSMLYRNTPNHNLANSIAALDLASTELRAISHQLMPLNFENIGLSNAIQETINKSGGDIFFKFMCLGNTRKLDNQTEIIIFGIASDIIAYISKNANSQSATIQLIYHEKELNLLFEYSGIHISENVEKIENIRTKSQFIEANLLIDSTIDGNSVILIVPFKP